MTPARKTALILAFSQAVIGSAPSISFSLGGLAGHYMLDADKSLATAPVTGFTVGVAVGALPAAWIMRKLGRRGGFMSGAMITGLGGALATYALFIQNFWLFAAALAFMGFGGSFVQQYRFAAADNAPSHEKARAISMVLAGGVFAAIIGPQTVIWTKEMLAPIQFAGPFAAIVGLALIGGIALSFLGPESAEATGRAAGTAPARPLLEIIRQKRFVVGLSCGVGSYALMSFVMTGAPLAMVGCGFSTDEATLGISWHVMAMFAPSFFTGSVIARFGKERVIAFGLALLIGCALVALSGIALWQFWLALILLGIGWNFAFIGATAIITECYTNDEKNAVQGFHDFVLFSVVAVASLMSGVVYNAWGWEALNWVIFPVTLFCMVLLAYLVATDKSRRTA